MAARYSLRSILSWLPALTIAATIFAISHSSAPPQIGPEFNSKDKLLHVLAYAVLGSTVFFPLRRIHDFPLRKTVLLAILITAAYGAFDEWHQSYIPNRHSDLIDWCADALGGALAAAVFATYEILRGKKTHR